MRLPSKSLTDSYDVLAQLAPLILEYQGKGLMAGLLPEGPEQRLPQQLRLGDYTLNITYERPASSARRTKRTDTCCYLRGSRNRAGTR